MRRLLPVLSLLAVVHGAAVHVAAAQMPPSIKKPIEMARKNAAATDAQTRAVDQTAMPASAAAQSKASTPAPAKQAAVAAKPGAKPGAKPVAPSAGSRSAPADDSTKITFTREVFSYVRDGRRDPFSSPIETGEIRPLVADLRVTGIIYDARGINSVVVMRDMSTQQQYRAKVGMILGRAKVSQIRPQEIVMTIDEYGFSRQEILKLNVQQTKGKP